MAARFEVVSKYKDIDIDLIPKRGTAYSAGFDFVAAEDIVVPSFNKLFGDLYQYAWDKEFEYKDFEKLINEAINNNKILSFRPKTLDEVAALTKSTKCKPTLISTGVKCKLDAGQYLELVSRSSSPLKYWLIQANAPGIVDADYYNSEASEGEIFFQVINLSPFPIQIKKGDKICQGLIKEYGYVEDELDYATLLPEIFGAARRKGGFGSTNDTIN